MMLTFGEFRLQVADRRLWHRATEIVLAPKAFDLLTYLAQRPSYVCSRDELFAALWPNTYVDDHALSVQIADVRRALGDSPKAPLYIETRSRRRYCFIAAVGNDTDAPSAAPVTAKAVERAPLFPETHYAST